MVEGNTINGIERLTGASKHTILRLLELAGTPAWLTMTVPCAA